MIGITKLTLPAISKLIAVTTRTLIAVSPLGQMLTASRLMIDQSVNRCSLSLTAGDAKFVSSLASLAIVAAAGSGAVGGVVR